MDYLLKILSIDYQFVSLIGVWGLCVFLWFLERIINWKVVLFNNVDIKKMFVGLILFYSLLDYGLVFENFYVPELGLYIDDLSRFFQIFIVVLLFSLIFLDDNKISWVNNGVDSPLCDLFLLVSLALVLNFLAIVVNLLSIILLFECSSLLLYIIGLRVLYKDLIIGEAMLKYVLSSAVSSGFLYISFFFLLFHSLFVDFVKMNSFGGLDDEVIKICSTNHPTGELFEKIVPFLENNLLLGLGISFFLISFFFKFGIFPFHFWMADLYQGLNFYGLGLFMILPKMVLFLIIVRFFYFMLISSTLSLSFFNFFWALLAVSSVILGAFYMVGQTNIRRLLAYSSIHNFGFVFLGIGSATFEGIVSGLTFMCVYSVILLLLVLVLSRINLLFNKANFITNLDQLIVNLYYSEKDSWSLILILLFILLGLPPSYGFFMKSYIIVIVSGSYADLNIFGLSGGIWLSLLALYGSVLSIMVYLNLLSDCFSNFRKIKPMYFLTYTPFRGNQSFFNITEMFIWFSSFLVCFYLSFGWCFFNPGWLMVFFKSLLI